ncbi:hypothetical protein EKB07_02105 [Streptococcus pseudopneumoniae]|nr:hypothetical protein [Streptococcus pseudopneumoniae]
MFVKDKIVWCTSKRYTLFYYLTSCQLFPFWKQLKKSPHSPSPNFECEDSTFHLASNGKYDKKIQL